MHDLHADVLFKTTKVNTLLQRHGNGFIDSYRKASFENVLVSYFYLGIKQNIKNHSLLKEKFFFLDSGAYSAMSTGTPVDVYQYIDWIKENRAMIDLYCGLDDIGDYKKTLENQRIMEAAGLHPLITFHYGEPFELLRDFCQEYEFICLGGIAGKRKQQRTPWLDNCFSVIKDYWPKRLHVFGVHDKDILLRYPFYSADASTDSLSAAMGNTAVGRMDDGKGVTLNKFQVMKGQANSTLTLSEKSQLRFATLAIKKEAIEKSITSIWAARGIKWE
ncbi:hypothetical protein KC887_00530 [Candidatus Kaiserbacteria bacterium]|nr:hypothetical protein [Candidatus Kaiserbacteria bacterium]